MRRAAPFWSCEFAGVARDFLQRAHAPLSVCSCTPTDIVRSTGLPWKKRAHAERVCLTTRVPMTERPSGGASRRRTVPATLLAAAPPPRSTYNYGVESYEMGTAFGHVAISVPDAAAACAAAADAGATVTRAAGPVKGGTTIIAFLKCPDGYSIELIQDRDRD